jgi:hypothetical protein
MPLKLARLLAVVVALVVPLQGMASVMAGQCMAFGHHDAPMEHADAGSKHDAHDHEHEAHESPETKSPHCGPCAACCGSASMAASPITVGAVSTVADAPYVFASLPPARLAPGELDRPPLAP